MEHAKKEGILIMYDYHLHTRYSMDSNAAVESMIQAAIDKGIKEIAVTDHIDYEFPNPGGNLWVVDMDDYLETLAQMQQKYRGQIVIRRGIELGIQESCLDRCLRFYEQYKRELDFIIASRHAIGGVDPYEVNLFQSNRRHQCYEEYFEAVASMVQLFPYASVYGHLDYLVRYDPGEEKYSYEEFAPLLDQILTQIIANGAGIELNTSGYRVGLGRPLPPWNIVQRYRELGGTILTTGSDAHSPEDVGLSMETCYQTLRSMGFTSISTFHERKAMAVPL